MGTFIITAIFNALAGSGAALGSIFLSSVGNISDVYQMDITPAGFTFSIWSVIYLWIAFSLLFFIITIFIKTDFGRLGKGSIKQAQKSIDLALKTSKKKKKRK